MDGQCTINKPQIQAENGLYGIIRYYTGIIRVLYGYYTGEYASGEIQNPTKPKMEDLGKKGIIRYYTGIIRVLYGYYTGSCFEPLQQK